MKRLILSAFLLMSSSLQAGLPPTTLSGQSQAVKPTTFTFKTPYSQSTQTTGIESLIETGNYNMLINPGFEGGNTVGVSTGWTNSGSSPAINTGANTTIQGKQSQGLILAAQTLQYQQSVGHSLALKNQQATVSIYAFIPSAIVNAQFCAVIDGAEQNCIPMNVFDQYFKYEIPASFGQSTIAVRVKTTGVATGTIYLDQAFAGLGSTFNNLNGDTVYSANVTTTSGALANQNKTFISSCTAAMPSVCTFATGIFSTAPNCVATIAQASTASAFLVTTATTVSITSITTSTGASLANQLVSLVCQKSGNDYISASSSAFLQNNNNYSRRPYTPTFTGLGTVTGVECYESRTGEYNDIDCKFTVGTATAVEARISLPGTLVAKNAGTLRMVGKGNNQTVSATRFSGFTVLSEPNVGYLTVAAETSSTSGTTKNNGNDFVASGNVIFNAHVPIEGWVNSPISIIALAGTPRIPDAGGRADTFDFSYGTTNLTTVCSGTPCFFTQDGSSSGLSNVTWTSAGLMTMVFGKTYNQMRCTGNSTAVGVMSGLSAMQCTNCSSLSFTSLNSSGAAANSFGTISCTGLY